MAKLYPPQLEGSLPAFVNTYDMNNNSTFLGTTLKIPFGLNRAVSVNSIKSIAIRIRTTSTNTFLVSDYIDTQHDLETGNAIFLFDKKKKLFNESQYYRVQIAFVDHNDNIGYYSTVGIIKCIAAPVASINGYTPGNINMFNDSFYGVYSQDTTYGDSTEKAYSYIFNIYDTNGVLKLTSNENIHDATQDTNSDTSQDFWRIYSEFDSGDIYYLEYIVTTLNGFVVSSPRYKIMKIASVPTEYDINLRAKNDYENGYIDVYLEGKFENEEMLKQHYYQLADPTKDYDDEIIYFRQQGLDFVEFDGTLEEWEYLMGERAIYIRSESDIYGEAAYSGNFVIKRSSIESNFTEWVEVARFALESEKPSTKHYKDQTVQQGIEYKYAFQQYNIHEIYSKMIPQSHSILNINGETEEVEDTVIADFEHIFISDGKRQLKISYNSKIKSFKTAIPEKKVETIGSKYPFIFRNGSVAYKEFSISGLISFQSDTAQLFLSQDELKESGILEQTKYRGISSKDIYYSTKEIENSVERNVYFIKEENDVYDIYTKQFLYTEVKYIMVRKPQQKFRYKLLNLYTDGHVTRDVPEEDNDSLAYVRTDTNLTSENFFGERYFRLKVLDWLNDGKVKLFRSSTEGNYLVRILNVSMTPEERLSRLLYNVSATIDEIDEISFENLTKYGLVIPKSANSYEEQWNVVNVREMLQLAKDPNYADIVDDQGFVLMTPQGISINNIMIQHFAPGDEVKILYDESSLGDQDTGLISYTIGVTGSLEVNDDERHISKVWVKVNPYVNTYNDFERELIYSYQTLTLSRFDAIADISLSTEVGEQYVGPKDNLLEPFDLRLNCYGIPNIDGVVERRWEKVDGIKHVYNDLLSNNHINYNIESLYNGKLIVEKYKATKIEILHVKKRDIIPIFAYKTEPIGPNTMFGITPFYQGYVNNQKILDYLENGTQTMRYVQKKDETSYENVIEIDETGNFQDSGNVSVYDIVTLGAITGYKNSLTIFQVFIWNPDIQDWEPSNTPGYKYYDNYTNSWWSGNTEYDPSFAINELQTFKPYYYNPETEEGEEISDPEIIGDNNIYLNDINELLMYNLDDIDLIRLGNGVVANITYQKRTVDYDLEETSYEVRQAKNDYLAIAESYGEQLDSVLDSLGESDKLESERNILENKLKIIDLQLESTSHTAIYEGVQQAANEQIIEQKVKLWDHREKIAQEIANFLQLYTLYTDIDINPPINCINNYNLIKVQNKYMIIKQLGYLGIDIKFDQNGKVSNISEIKTKLSSAKTTLIKNGHYQTLLEQQTAAQKVEEEFNAYINQTSGNETILNYRQKIEKRISNLQSSKPTYQDIFSAETIGGLILNELPTTIIQNRDKFYDYIHNSYQIDIDYYQEQKLRYATTINDYEQQIAELQAQQGELIGGFDIVDYDDSNPPPEHTIIYYDYLLNKLNKKYADELLHINRQKAELVNRLLSLNIDKAGNLLTTIQNATATYLYDNADALINLLTAYNNHATSKLNKIKALYLKDICNEINSDNILNSNQLASLTKILKEDRIVTTDIIRQQVNSDLQDEIQYTYTDITNGKIYEQICKLFTPKKTLEQLYNEIKNNANGSLKKYLSIKFSGVSAYDKAYSLYGAEIEAEQEIWTNAISILEDIKKHPGNEGRNYNFRYENYNYPYRSVAQTFNNKINQIRDEYVTVSERAINDWLATNPFDLKNLVFFTKEIEANDKAFAILDLFTDKVNYSQATSIKEFLDEYYPADIENESKQLVQQIKHKDILYAERIDKLDKTKNIYLKNKQLIQDEIDNLDNVINELHNKEEAVRKQYNIVLDQLLLADELNDILESKHFFYDILVYNDSILDNFKTLASYIYWIYQNQNALIQQLGHLDNTVHTGEEYGDFLKKYIDMYELEAFDFLHRYTSVEEDLSHGYDNTETANPAYSPGIDKFQFDLSHYFLSVYKDILYILDEETDSNTRKYLTLLKSNEIETRQNGYKQLENHMADILYGRGQRDSTSSQSIRSYTLGMLLSDDGLDDKLVILEYPAWTNRPEPYYYPTIRTFGPNSQVITTAQTEGAWIIPSGYQLLRAPIEENQRSFVDVDIYYSDGVYHKNPFQRDTKIYIKSESSINHLILAFDYKDMDDEEFDAAIKYYASIGKKLVWLTDSAPITCSGYFYSFLYDWDVKQLNISKITNLDYYTNLGLTINENDKLLITPLKKYNYLKNYLGKITHDIPNDQKTNPFAEEYGSFYGILEASMTMFDLIAAYFHVNKSIYLNSNIEADNPNDKENLKNLITYLISLETKLASFQDQEVHWEEIISQSEFTLDGYRLEGIKEDDGKIKQLKSIIASARQKRDYYTDAIIKWKQEINTLTNTNLILKDYFLAKQASRTIERDLSNLINKTNNNCSIYRQKCDHYLKLLFNNVPFGVSINQDIISREEILHINNNETPIYNYGIAYSLEKYKKFYGDVSYSHVDFSAIIQKARDFENKFYKNFPLIEKVTSPDATYKEGRYFIKVDDKTYMPYMYLDQENWRKDLQTSNLYFTNYPELCIDFINYHEYYPVDGDNILEVYDSNKNYYLKDSNNDYIPIDIKNEYDFERQKAFLYYQGNGGLRRIFHDMLGIGATSNYYGISFDKNQYLENIEAVYFENLDLYHKLLIQIRGDALENLQELKYEYETRLTEIQNLLNKLTIIKVDKERLTKEIYQKFAEYLYLLTITYIDTVERGYDIV